MRQYLALLFVLAAIARSGDAQTMLPITTGERVRITFDAGRYEVVGALLAQVADSLRVQPSPNARPEVLARSSITRVEVSAGTHGHAGTGALIGLLSGAGVGAALGSGCEGEFFCPGPGGGALVFGLAGTAFGALVGVFVRTERWALAYPEAVHVGFVPVSRAPASACRSGCNRYIRNTELSFTKKPSLVRWPLWRRSSNGK